MNLVTLVQEASRTGEYPRLNRRAAVNVLRSVAEWLETKSEEVGPGNLVRILRDEITQGKGSV